MDELNGMTDADLQAATRELESQIKKQKTLITRVTTENKQLDARIKENQEKLKMCTQLPHMVANVGELLDVEDEAEEGKEGSGFKIKKTAD